MEGQDSGCENRCQKNVHKLNTVYLALSEFLPFIQHKHVLVRTDSTIAVYHINTQGGTPGGKCTSDMGMALSVFFKGSTNPKCSDQVSQYLIRYRASSWKAVVTTGSREPDMDLVQAGQG